MASMEAIKIVELLLGWDLDYLLKYLKRADIPTIFTIPSPPGKQLDKMK